MEALAKQIYPSAEFIGAKHGDELKPYFAEADLFVLPGTGGLAVQEAMSHGLPVIVAKGDGTQDDLVRAENGWQIPPGDYGALGIYDERSVIRCDAFAEDGGRVVPNRLAGDQPGEDGRSFCDPRFAITTKLEGTKSQS